jgi:tetratricopeptide (TPR) repeat protein
MNYFVRSAIPIVATFAMLSLPHLTLADEAAFTICNNEQVSADQRIAACTKVMEDARQKQNHGPALYKRATVYLLGKRDFDRAIVEFTEFLKSSPKYAPALLGRGMAFHLKNESDRALADYDAAIAIDGTMVNARIVRSQLYGQRKDFDRSVSDLKEILRLDPRNVHAHVSLGGVYVEKKDYDNASVEFGEALRIDPTAIVAYRGRVVIYLDRQDHRKALDDYSEIIRLGGKESDYRTRAYLYRQVGDMPRAAADLAEADRIKERAK